jgi:hypothetical protein
MQKLFAALLLVLVFAVPGTPVGAQGQTYYVDPSGSDDTGNGSMGNPWRTIRHAAAQVAGGDMVLINPGTYEGGVVVETAGTSSAPVTFRANGAGTIIEGSGGQRDAIFIDGADYIVLDGLTIQQADRAGLRISWSDHVVVRNCTFADNGRWGVFTDFSDHTLIEGCESYGAVEEHGIYISNSSDYPTIRANRLHHNYSCGLHMNGDVSMGGDGIISYGLIEGNIIYENGFGGGSAINMDGVTDTAVRNNVLYDNHASGISLYRIDGGSGARDNWVVNNSIIVAADGRWAINIPDLSGIGNKLYNNIIFNYHGWRGSILIAEPTPSGFESDYNVVVNRFSGDGGDTNMSLAQWQTLGYDAHSIIATPEQLFVDPADADFHLGADSPCIDAGNNAVTNLPAQDFEGNERRIDDPATPDSGNGTAPLVDIGADEFLPVASCDGDFRGDGDVDSSDLSVFAADFGRTDCATGDPCEGDFDTDNDADAHDLSVFTVDFGRTDCL